MIFILNKQEKVVNILKNGGGANQAPPFFDDVYTQDLATGAETFSFSTIAINKVASDLVVGNYVAFKNEDGEYKLFQITQTEEYHEDAMYMNVYAEGAGLELINKVFRARKAPSTSLRRFMEMVLDDTGWNVGAIPFSAQESLDLDLPDATVYSTLQSTLSKYGVEMAFRCEINHGRISSKFIDLYEQRGRITGKRFSFGRDIEGIKRKVDSTELFTALIGRGNKDISFKDVTVDGIDKPLGQDFVADQDAYDRYNNNGYHIIGIFKYDTDSPEELLRETYKQLEKCKEPKIEYEVSVALLGELLGESWNKVRIGDTVAIVDNSFNPPVHLMARVSKLEKSFTNNQSDTCTLANFIEVQSNINDEMRKLASELEGYVDGALDKKFPIGGEDIQQGAINGSHIYENTISTDHLIADAITTDKIKANTITTKHLQSDSIKSHHISAEQIEAEHIKSGTITAEQIATGTITAESGIIADGTIGTAQIKDAEITVAKIQDAFVDSLVANQGKFQSAHIGILTSENIDADTIKADHIMASVIDAINLNVEGKISADKIDVTDLVVDNIDAGKITTGTLDADRIASSVITAINASLENATIDSAKIGEIDAGKITTGELSSDVIKSNVISAINASIGKISADRIDVDSIRVNNIDAGQITTGDLSADRIQSTVISAINSYTGTAKIKQAQIETLKVGNANIIDLDASKITTGKINAERIDADKLTVKSANITGEISASKISGGTLDASKMTVTNLKADSITAGSITVQGENLIHNSVFTNGISGWEKDTTVTYSVDTDVKYLDNNTVKVVKSGATSDVWSKFCQRVPCSAGESFVASAYIKIAETDSSVNLALEYYDKSGSRVARFTDRMSSVGDFKRFVVSGVAPTNAVQVMIRLEIQRNATVYATMFMLSRGTIASVWKPHTDELISDGAIDTNKIANEAINSDKLNVDELFVGDNAFIKSLKAVEIDASNITTGTISGERIDMRGLISFESLNQDLQKVFDVQGDKTYINGGLIATNTIKANSIDLLSGLTVKGEDNTTTFAIASNGEVEVNGLLKSGNFDENKNTGYRLSTDGKAILNQAVVKGDVILPNAGMTNYGSTVGNENLIKNSDFRYGSSNWTFSNYASVDNNKLFEGSPTLKISKSGLTSDAWGGATQDLVGIKGNANIRNKEFTISFWYYVEDKNSIDQKIAVELKGRNESGTHVTVGGYWITTPNNIVEKKWTFVSFKVQPTNESLDKLFIYPWVQRNGTVWYAKIKVELSSEPTPWCPHKDEQINYTRFWAGTSFENRDNAPFRVLQNGDIYATNGTFNGKMYGDLDSGLVHIHNNEIVVNSISTFMDDSGEVMSIQPMDYNPNPYIRLGAGTSIINTDLILGSETDKKVVFSNSNKQLNLHNTSLNLISPTRTSGAKVSFNPNGSYNSAFGIGSVIENTNANLTIGYHNGGWANTSIITHNGSRGGSYGDVCFKRSDTNENLDVTILGNMKIRNSLQSTNQNIEMRSVSNEGWGFYAT